MDRSPIRVAPAILVLVLVLAGCGHEATSSPSDSRDVVDCGAEETRHGEGMSVAGRQCLLAAFAAGEPALFASGAVTVEGAPIGYTFRTHAQAPVVMVVDARNDPLGSGRIETYFCERLVPVDEWNEVTGAGMPADAVWVQDGCLPADGA